MSKNKSLSLITTLVILALPAVAFWQRLAIFDQVRLYGYNAPSAVAQLASDTTMLPSMRRLFYVYHPAIENKTDFNASCREDEQTIVLGCYIDTRGIYLLSVSDARLTGVEQVTAAHETLHAAYARLSSGERSKVDAMTEAAFAGLNDQRITDTVALYRKQDPTVVPNELHSILGTEVATLPPDLETYYKRYFSDRAKIVAYSAQYEQAFTDRKNQVAAYDAQLATLKTQINNLQATLTTEAATLSDERNRLNGLKSSGQIAAYNSAVPGYNDSVNNYNANIDALSRMVDEYNAIVPVRNGIASEEQDLVQAIDSRTSVPAHQ